MNQEKKSKSTYKFQKLTPINDAKLAIYEDALNFAFEDDQIKNVAISGPYSAGKSSIIESYKKIKSNKKFLHISLAHFRETNLNTSTANNSDQVKNDPESGVSSNSPLNDNAILEGKILNQLIHQINQDNIPQTAFKIKEKLVPEKIIKSAIFFTIFLLLMYYIYAFDRWSSFVPTLQEQMKDRLMWTTSNTTLVLSGLICFVIIGIFIYHLIIFQKNNNILKRLKIQGNEIEIFHEEKDASFFDKYLNEVLYLFDNSDADVVVFEDMDRFNANLIFEKLKEINTLINNKRVLNNKNPIRFFYLLRDDIFTSKDRTKFFDFIIPVVPVIDGSNSYDKLIQHFESGEISDLFDENYLSELSLYIDDMRMLKNIYNEFIIYRNRILSTNHELQTEKHEQELDSTEFINLDNNKLLGIIVYKNIFPKDFSDLHLRKGFVFTLFEKKDLLIEQEVEKINEEINEIKDKIQSTEDEVLESINELDALYLGYIKTIYDINRKPISADTWSGLVQEMKDNPDDIRFYNHLGHLTRLDISALLEELDKKPTYTKRKETIERKSGEQISKLRTTIQELKKQKSTIENSKLKEFITKVNIDSIFNVTYTNEIGEENNFSDIKRNNYFPLIKYLVRYGYIDESYSDYMTYFHEYSLNRIDKNFLLSITDQQPKNYSYSLYNPEKIISRLNPGHFHHVEVLNFDLLSHLLITKSENYEYLNNLLQQLKDTRNYDFIGGFLELKKEKETVLFIKELNNLWPDIFYDLEDEFSYEQKKQYAIYSLYYSIEEEIKNLNKNNCLTNFISESSDFLDIEAPNVKSLITGFSIIEVKFSWINNEVSNSELLKEVYKNNLYKLTFNLINLMLEIFYGLPKNKDFISKNYKLVNSKPDEPLAQYVNYNFDLYLKEVLENCNEEIRDDEPVALEIINRESEVDKEDVSAYIGYLKTIIQSINSVKNHEFWPEMLQNKIVEYSERNILDYLFNCGMDSKLIEFINTSENQLEFNWAEIEETFGEGSASKFLNAIVVSNKLTNERYESILDKFDGIFKSFSNTEIEEDKMTILIKTGTFTMTEENLIFIRENYRNLLLFFIAHNIAEYTEVVNSEDNFEIDELLLILDEDIEEKYKISLLEFTSDSITLKDKNYSESVMLHILEYNFDVDDVQFLLDSYTDEKRIPIKKAVKDIAIKNLYYIESERHHVPIKLLIELFKEEELTWETKKELFALYLPKLNEEEAIQSLKILKMDDFLSLFQRQRPKFERSEANEKILESFKERRWIKTFEIDKGNNELFRAYGRDKSDILNRYD